MSAVISPASSISGFLLEKILNGVSLQALLDEIFRKWYVPSLFLDINQQIVFYSVYSGEPDTWDAVLSNGQLSSEMRIRLAECSRLTSGRRNGTSAPGVFVCEPNAYIYSPVYKEENLIGYIVVVCLRGRSRDTVLSLCSHLSESIGFLNDSATSYTPIPFSYAHSFIAQELLLLDDAPEDIDAISEAYGIHSQKARTAIRPSFRVAAIVQNTPDVPQGSLEKAEQYIHTRFPDVYSLIHNSTLFVFFHGLTDQGGKIDPVFLDRLSAVPDRYHLRIALSVPFTDLSLRLRFKRQALDLLDMSTLLSSDIDILIAEERFKELLFYAPYQRIGPEAFRLNEVCILQENDRVYGTDYFETLYQYLRHSGHNRRAADALHIEPKSLQYRLRKICSLTGRDADDLLLDNELFFSVSITHTFQKKS